MTGDVIVVACLPPAALGEGEDADCDGVVMGVSISDRGCDGLTVSSCDKMMVKLIIRPNNGLFVLSICRISTMYR